MADPLSVVAGVTGVLAFTAKLAQEVITMISDIKDAPRDIADLQFDLRNLSSLVLSAHSVSVRYPLRPEDKPLEDTVKECLEQCQTVIDTIKERLSMFQGKGKAKSLMRRGMWYLRKVTIKDERDRLRDSKAMVELSITVFNAHLMGKGQQEILDEMARGYEKLSRQFRDDNQARRLRRKLHDDLETVSGYERTGGRRRESFSATTDASLPLKKFLELDDSSTTVVSESAEQSPDTLRANSNSGLQQIIRPSDESPVLIQAAQAGNTQQVQALVAMGVSPLTRNPDGRTALHFCAVHDDVATAQVLLDRGANVDAKDDKHRSPFRVAISNESFGVAALLVQKGCAFDESVIGIPTLFDTIKFGEGLPSLPEFLAALRERVNDKNKTGHPCLLHEAVDRNDDAILRIFLTAGGFDPNTRDASGVSPIHMAILLRRRATVKLLLDHGADKNDFLPIEPTRKLLRPDRYPWHKPLADQFRDDGVTPLITAGRATNDAEMVRILLESGADPNWKVPPGRGIVLAGVCAGHHFTVAKLLIDHGANPNHTDKSGIGPMYWATALGNVELLRYMFERGKGDVNKVFDSRRWKMPKWTMLHLAVSRRLAGVVKLLLEKGADVTIKDVQGKTALDLLGNGEDFNGVRGLLEKKMEEAGLVSCQDVGQLDLRYLGLGRKADGTA